MLAIDELLTPLTSAQVKAKLYELCDSMGISTSSWISGAVTRTLIAALSEIYGSFVAPLIVTIAKSGFLDDAESGWLTLRAATYFEVDRRVATYASGTVTLDNAGGGIFTFDVAEAVFKNSATNATYINTESFTLGALQTGLDVDVRAVDLGSIGSALGGQIDTIVTTMSEVTVTNADDMTGVDEETDDELRARCRDALGALSPDGPAAAYRYVALTPALNGGANINRVKVVPATGDATVTVLIASPDGAPTPTDVTLVQAGFDEWATPDSVIATAVAATEYAITVDATVKVDAAAQLTNDQWADLIKANLVAWVAALPIEGLVFPPATSGIVPFRAIIGVIERTKTNTTSGTYSVLHAELDSEADIAVPANNVVTLDSGDITLTITQVALP